MDEEKLDKIISKLEGIEDRLINIELDVAKCKQSCDKMDSHISFIEIVYTSLKNVMNRFVLYLPDISKVTENKLIEQNI